MIKWEQNLGSCPDFWQHESVRVLGNALHTSPPTADNAQHTSPTHRWQCPCSSVQCAWLCGVYEVTSSSEDRVTVYHRTPSGSSSSPTHKLTKSAAVCVEIAHNDLQLKLNNNIEVSCCVKLWHTYRRTYDIVTHVDIHTCVIDRQFVTMIFSTLCTCQRVGCRAWVHVGWLV